MARGRCGVVLRFLAIQALGWAVAVGPGARAEEADDLAAEIERAREEEDAEAAGLRDAMERGAALPPEMLAEDPGPPVVGMPSLPAAPFRGEALTYSVEHENYQVPPSFLRPFEQLFADEEFREAGCFVSHRELDAASGDRIRHRAIGRADFRARRENRDIKSAVEVEHSVTAAHVATSVSCIGRLRAEQLMPGRFAVWYEGVEYVAHLDPKGSWWNKKTKGNPEWVLRHEQLHFDITELVARQRTAEREQHAAETRSVADSPGEAMRAFGARWAAHMRALRADWEALQEQYDRETRHGTVPKQQTAWYVRIHRELAASPAPAR